MPNKIRIRNCSIYNDFSWAENFPICYKQNRLFRQNRRAGIAFLCLMTVFIFSSGVTSAAPQGYPNAAYIQIHKLGADIDDTPFSICRSVYLKNDMVSNMNVPEASITENIVAYLNQRIANFHYVWDLSWQKVC